MSEFPDPGPSATFVDDVLHITAASPHTAHTDKKRFIVEPQVLNAALDINSDPSAPVFSPTFQPGLAPGGLYPAPRPGSNKGRPPRSHPGSPSASGEYPYLALASSPVTPLSSPAGRSPRLSNILRGLEDHELSPHVLTPNRIREPSPAPSPTSLASLPSSPEILASAGDPSVARATRQKRYLSGLHKITKLAKARRMSDAGIPSDLSDRNTTSSPGGGKKGGSDDLSSRYRRMLDLKKGSPSASLPSSPVSPPLANGVAASFTSGLRSRTASGSASASAAFTSACAGRDGDAQMQWQQQQTVDDRRRARAAGAGGRLAGVASAHLSHVRDQSWASSPHVSSSETSHEPPSSLSTDARISISSSIYSSSFSNSSSRRRPHTAAPMPATSPDRESFIDLASPTFSPRTFDFQYFDIPQPTSRRHSPESEANSTFSSSSRRSGSAPSNKPRLAPINTLDKPPVPTAPKPDFSHRSRSAHRASPIRTANHAALKQGPMSAYPADHTDPSDPAFAFSNALSPKERAERLRTTRKLAQVFGQPPGVSPVALEPAADASLHDGAHDTGCLPVPGPLSLTARRRHHRPVASLSEDVSMTPIYDAFGTLIWPPPDGTRYLSLAAPRRHSAPLSPDEISFVSRLSLESDSDAHTNATHHPPIPSVASSAVIHIGPAQRDEHASERASTASRTSSHRGAHSVSRSPTSFIDLSDEEGALPETPRPHSPSTASLADSLALQLSEEEDERRRKREKLAKLHRFLGSRVPPHLVLGPFPTDEDPTPQVQVPSRVSAHAPVLAPLAFEVPGDSRSRAEIKMRRRRSSSAAEFSRSWSDDIDRLKQGLNEREKAINVRRAVKMEKMFGVAPPQTLYHTRAPTVSAPNNLGRDLLPLPTRQQTPKPKTPTLPPAHAPAPSASLPAFRFPTSSGPKGKKNKRPGTGDSASSSRPLLSAHAPRTGASPNAHEGLLEAGESSVYMHYRHSLNSLSDILDRDDRESLAELHDYLTGSGDLYATGEQYDYKFAGAPDDSHSATPGAGPSLSPPMTALFADPSQPQSHSHSSPLSPLSPATPTAASTASTASAAARAERRRSLPSRVSVASFASDISALLSAPEEAAFQQRRRRAAKLTHFFGVDYRELMNEVLESIEKGLEEERGRGTLRPDEVRDLQQKLVSLKTKRNSLAR